MTSDENVYYEEMLLERGRADKAYELLASALPFLKQHVNAGEITRAIETAIKENK